MSARRRWRAAAPLMTIAAAMAAAACAESRPAEEAAAEADTVVAAASADSAALRACDLITEQQLEDILAVDLEPGRITNDHPADSQCRWDLPGDPQRGVSISLRQLADLELYERVPGSVAASGIGDAAVWNADYGQLAVLAGERVISVALLIAEPERAHAEHIARTALERL